MMGVPSAKARIKAMLLKRLHAREEIVSRIATRVVREGVPRAYDWSFDAEREATLAYVAARRSGDFAYAFAAGTPPTLYGSLYAFMLTSILGAFPDRATIDGWIDHFDAHQTEDGMFRDARLASEAFEHRGGWGEGWGGRHLAAHFVIPYARAGRTPPRPFVFLEPFYDLAYLNNWLAGFNFSERLWSQSNYVMNLYSLMQFARDHMGETRAEAAVATIAEWLLKTQNPATGLWHTRSLGTPAEANDAIRGAYHYYLMFEYDGIDVPHQGAAIDVILATQNAWGAFEEEDRPAGACEDMDALDPLLRFARRTGHRADDVRRAAYRAFVWLCACRNADGGSMSLPEHGCSYGGHPATTSRPGESNLFATWFRTLTMAYVTRFLGIPEAYVIGRYPGYEIPLPNPDIMR